MLVVSLKKKFGDTYI